MTPTLAATLWPASAASTPQILRAVVLAVLGSLFVALSAQILVPMYPVPMTMQPFAVLIVGAAFGARLGAATLVLYAIEGALGLPVFHGAKGGLPHLMGPTGGYILGFVLAAGAVGWLAERGWDCTILRTVAAMIVGMALIYLPGALWLSSFMGVEKAIQAGVVPFLIGDAVKVALAALVLPGAWALIGRSGR
jgi:biotin transport system substrate-specific component